MPKLTAQIALALALLAAPGCSLFKSDDANNESTTDESTTDDSTSESTSDDTSANASSCGWDASQKPPAYYCGGSGEDPDGIYPMACPDGMVEGAACGILGGEGCCDANGDNWYCGDDGNGYQFLVLQDCI